MSAVQEALKELRAGSARNVPSAIEIENAAPGTVWHGAKSSGGTWKLIKNNADSYSAFC